jgi:mannan endo-1,4-beta-mannosidase
MSSNPPEGLIAVRGTRFLLGEREIVPHGVNSYPLLQHAGDERWDAVDDIFAQAVALGRPFVRTNAFMDGGRNPARLRDEDGSLREAGMRVLDALIARAAHFGVRLLLALTNNWTDSGGAPKVIAMIAAGEGLSKDAFYSDPRAIAAQQAFVHALATRTNHVTGHAYRDDPTIFAWELANEARSNERPRGAGDPLVAWARTMADVLRDAGARQPIAWGGSGHRGKRGEDLDAIADDGAVDVLTLHLYPGLHSRWSATFPDALRSTVSRALGAAVIHDRTLLARRYGMPLLLEELGHPMPARVRGVARDRERAEVLRALLAVADEHGIAAFPWMIGERGRQDYDGHLIRPEDEHTTAVLTVRSESASPGHR